MSKIIINYPDSVDLTEYSKASTEIIKYGLPKDVKFCNSCVMTNQLPKSEVEHTHNGKELIKKFLFNICKAKCNWIIKILFPIKPAEASERNIMSSSFNHSSSYNQLWGCAEKKYYPF